MTAGRRRLVTLAAVLAPARAPALLGRLGGAEGPAAVALAASLAAAPRRARLAALAAALAVEPPAARARQAPAHPLLARLHQEWTLAAGRTEVGRATRGRSRPPGEAA